MIMKIALRSFKISVFTVKISFKNASSIHIFGKKLGFAEISRSEVFGEVTMERNVDNSLYCLLESTKCDKYNL